MPVTPPAVCSPPAWAAGEPPPQRLRALAAFKEHYLAQCRTLLAEPVPALLAVDAGQGDSLSVSLRTLGPKGATAIARALAAVGTDVFSSIALPNCFIGNEGCDELCRSLLPAGVSRLNLGGNNIQGSGIRSIAALLYRSASLTALSLEWNPIGCDVEALAVLCEAVGRSPVLRSLDLRNTRTGPDGAGLIARALRSNKALTRLDLQWNRIGPVGGDALLSALAENETLTELTLTGCDLDYEVLQRIGRLGARNAQRAAERALSAEQEARPQPAAPSPASPRVRVEAMAMQKAEQAAQLAAQAAEQAALRVRDEELAALRAQLLALQQQADAARQEGQVECQREREAGQRALAERSLEAEQERDGHLRAAQAAAAELQSARHELEEYRQEQAAALEQAADGRREADLESPGGDVPHELLERLRAAERRVVVAHRANDGYRLVRRGRAHPRRRRSTSPAPVGDAALAAAASDDGGALHADAGPQQALADDSAELQAERKEHARAAQAASEELQRVREELDDRARRCEGALAKQSDLERMLALAEAEKARMSDRLADAVEQLNRARDDAGALRATAERSDKLREAAEERRAELDERVRKLQNQAAHERLDQEREKELWRQQLAREHREETARLERQVLELQELARARERQLATRSEELERQAERYARALDEAEGQKRRAVEQNAAFDAERAQLNQRLNESEAERRRLGELLHEAEGRAETARGDAQRAERAHQQELERLSERFAADRLALERRVVQLQTRGEQLEGGRRGLEDRLKRLQEEGDREAERMERRLLDCVRSLFEERPQTV
eukprot:TRINITY_DN8073_c4_g1_i1.p1 TRINITY_DN8073_c4_g1~~TRINITY_DN8073_c4_g1_i1.p1  ORF type:complete len:830 (+),score=318.14 TRINITY_DN8073_c4_g1_i1:75-2492(+)